MVWWSAFVDTSSSLLLSRACTSQRAPSGPWSTVHARSLYVPVMVTSCRGRPQSLTSWETLVWITTLVRTTFPIQSTMYAGESSVTKQTDSCAKGYSTILTQPTDKDKVARQNLQIYNQSCWTLQRSIRCMQIHTPSVMSVLVCSSSAISRRASSCYISSCICQSGHCTLEHNNWSYTSCVRNSEQGIYFKWLM